MVSHSESFYRTYCIIWSQRQHQHKNLPMITSVLFTHGFQWLYYPRNTTPHRSPPVTSPTTSKPCLSCLVPQVHSTEKCVGTRLVRQCWLLPALSMRQWVLLACDERGTPHWAAVAVSKPTHRGGWWVGGAPEAMVRLSLCSQRWGWAPHHRCDRKKASVWTRGIFFVSLFSL